MQIQMAFHNICLYWERMKQFWWSQLESIENTVGSFEMKADNFKTMFLLNILKSGYDVQVTRAFILKLVFSKCWEHLWFCRMKKKGKTFWNYMFLDANQLHSVNCFGSVWLLLRSRQRNNFKFRKHWRSRTAAMLHAPFLLLLFYFPMEKCYLYLLKTHDLPESFPLFLTNEHLEKIQLQLQVPQTHLSDGTQREHPHCPLPNNYKLFSLVLH